MKYTNEELKTLKAVSMEEVEERLRNVKPGTCSEYVKLYNDGKIQVATMGGEAVGVYVDSGETGVNDAIAGMEFSRRYNVYDVLRWTDRLNRIKLDGQNIEEVCSDGVDTWVRTDAGKIIEIDGHRQNSNMYKDTNLNNENARPAGYIVIDWDLLPENVYINDELVKACLRSMAGCCLARDMGELSYDEDGEDGLHVYGVKWGRRMSGEEWAAAEARYVDMIRDLPYNEHSARPNTDEEPSENVYRVPASNIPEGDERHTREVILAYLRSELGQFIAKNSEVTYELSSNGEEYIVKGVKLGRVMSASEEAWANYRYDQLKKRA